MTPEEKTEMERLKALEIANKAEIATLTATVAEKDGIIETKNQDLVGLRKEGQKLKALSDEDKKTMSQMEIAHHEALLGMQTEAEGLRADIAARDLKEVGARRAAVFKKLAGTDADLTKALEEKFASIVDHDKATTEEEIAKIAADAWKMVPQPARDPMAEIMGRNEGGAPDGGAGNGFAETAGGKTLAETMGLQSAKPAEEGAK